MCLDVLAECASASWQHSVQALQVVQQYNITSWLGSMAKVDG